MPASTLPPPVAMPEELIDLKIVMRRTCLSRSMITKLIAAGKFPPRIKITEHTTRWSARAIDAWIQDRIAAATATGDRY